MNAWIHHGGERPLIGKTICGTFLGMKESPTDFGWCKAKCIVSSDLFIIVACTVAGGAVGSVRCLQAVGAGSYRTTSVFRHIVRGVVVGLVLGLLVSELRQLW